MTRYLNYIDTLKEKFIKDQDKIDLTSYPITQFHYYQSITYIVDDAISFCQSLQAVKVVNTAILFVDPETHSRVYFTDNDIASIIATIDNPNLMCHIQDNLKKVIERKRLDTLSFQIESKRFNIKGIPLNETFNNVFCENPADISINGNDLIALINLILEKERTDRDPMKLYKTSKKYLGLA